MERDVSQMGSTKRKLFEESSYGDGKGKKPRLQVTIPRLQLSQKQLERLRKISSKHQKAPLITNKEDGKENVATVNASASSSASTTETASPETVSTEAVSTETVSTATVSTETVSTETVSTETVSTETVSTETVSTETVSTETVSTETVSTETVSTETVSTETTTVVKEPVTTEEESPIRRSLPNLLDGSSLSPFQDSAVHSNEEDVATVTVSVSATSSASTRETVSTETTTVVKEPVTTEEESPIRHRLTNLLNGSSLSPFQDSAAHSNEEDVATVSVSATSSESTRETVSTETTTSVKELITTEGESPIRHRLTNLLDGSSLSPFQDSAAHSNEENVKSINCKGAGQLNNAESLSGPVSTEKNLFSSDELLFSDNGLLSPLMHEEDCITVPCYPDVVSETCMQVEIGCTQTSSDNKSQTALASEQNKEEDHETNQRLQPSSVEEMSSVPEEGNEPRSVSQGSCDVLGQRSNNAVPGEKEAENGNAEEGSGVLWRSAEVRAEDSIIDYSSHYSTLEAMNTLLTKFTEEKRARTELEELVSHLEEKNKELLSECVKLKDLVNDLLPSSKVKNETVSRGIQINMDLSLRRGRTVDRATSPLRMREPSPELRIQSLTTGCQTVDLSNEMKSTACQTDPPLEARLLATCTTQSAPPARVQGIVMPNVKGRAPVQVPNYTLTSNPVQMSYSQTSSFQQQSANVTVSQSGSMQSQQGHPSWQMLAHKLPNKLQTTGYNNAAGPHVSTLNSSHPTGAALYYAQVAQNQFMPISSLTTTQMSRNQTLVGSNPGAYSGAYDTAIERNAVNCNTLSTQHATRPDTLNQSIGQRLNLNTDTLSPLFTQKQLWAHSSLSLSHQTLSSAQSTSHNSRPSQFAGALQHSTRQQTTPTNSLQISANAQSGIRDVLLHLTNGWRRQITNTTVESSRHPQQPPGASLPSRMVYNQVTIPQHKEGPPLQHQASLPIVSQAQQLTSLRNSQQSLGTFPQSRVGYNQGTVPRQTGGLRIQHQVPQPEGSRAMPHTQTSSALSRNSQQPLGTFPQRRVSYNQVAAPQQTGGLRIQHEVSQPEASQAHLRAQPVQRNNVNRMTGQQSDQTPSSSRTSSTDNHLAGRLLEDALDRRAGAHVEAFSLYNEVQLVYSELKKSLSDGTYKQQQSSTTEEPRSLDHQLRQLLTSRNTQPSNKQPPDAACSTNSLSSVSEQSPLYCRTSANQLPSQVSHSPSLSNGTRKPSNHFSQEAVSNIPVGASPGSPDGPSRLGSSAVRQTDGKGQKSPIQNTLHRLSVDNDPYKVPPKTPSGALEDVVKKLLSLQNEIARTENVSGTGRLSSNSVAESTDGTSKDDNTTESKQSKQTLGVSESTPLSERDSNNEALQHHSSNPGLNSAETVSLNQGADTHGLSKDQHNNNCCLSRNQEKATEDTSVSPTSDSVLDTDFNKMQTEIEPPSPVHDGNGNATEKEEHDNDDGDGQDTSVRDRQDSSSPCPSVLSKGSENKDPEDSDDAENDSSSQDIYAHLMSPIIPRIAAARRVRSRSDAHTTENTCDEGTSTSSFHSPMKNVNSEHHSMECDPEPKRSSDEREHCFKGSQQEGMRTCATVPLADVHCNHQEHGNDTASNREQENAVNDQARVPLSSDVTMEEMQLEVSSTGGIVTDLSDAQRATCNIKIQEMPKTNLPEEQRSTEMSEGQRDLLAAVPVLNCNVKLEASDGPCMGGVAQGNDKEGRDEQYQKCQLDPKAIPTQNFVCLNSTFQETPNVGDIEKIKKASLTLPLPSSLVKENVEEKSVSPISVDFKTIVEFNNKNSAVNNEPSPPVNTSPLPVPRLALRIMNGNAVIMWDLPPDNKITDISLFEVYVFLKNRDGRVRQNHTGRWIKVGEMKAMPLPMACTLRQIIQRNVLYLFIVRAVGNNGLPGPFSKPCCVSSS